MPFRSLPIACASCELDSCSASSEIVSSVNAIAQPSRTTEYAATGPGSAPASPSQAVLSGVSESQKSRCMFAHSVRPSIVLTICIRWWWLFQ